MQGWAEPLALDSIIPGFLAITLGRVYLENDWKMLEMGEKSKRGVMICEGWGKFSSWLCSVKGLRELCDAGRDQE